MKKIWVLILLALPFLLLTQSFATVANIDFESDPSDVTYVGDNGILSNTGGDVWNSILYDQVSASFLLDENGTTTGIDLEIDQTLVGPYVDARATNDLQDTGLSGSGFSILNLIPGQTYDVAVYVGPNTAIKLKHNSGDIYRGYSAGAYSYVLPGSPYFGYFFFNDLVPFDIGGGIYGFQVHSINGGITGVQISGNFPPGGEPSVALVCDPPLDEISEIDLHIFVYDINYSKQHVVPVVLKERIFKNFFYIADLPESLPNGLSIFRLRWRTAYSAFSDWSEWCWVYKLTMENETFWYTAEGVLQN